MIKNAVFMGENLHTELYPSEETAVYNIRTHKPTQEHKWQVFC